MKLKDLRQIASVDRLLVVFTNKDGYAVRKPQLEVLPSQIAKHDKDSVVKVEAVLETSSPSEANGSIQVTPCLQAWVFHREE